mgnify:CR=1 FL=1
MFDDWAWKSYNRVLSEAKRLTEREPTPFKSPAQQRYKALRKKNAVTHLGGHKDPKSSGSPFTGEVERPGTSRLRFEDLREIVDDGIDFSSLEAKDSLSPDIWENERLKPEVSERLSAVAKDFISSLKMDLEIKDVFLVGSMAGYNYSKYSDIDLHVVLDFEEISPDKELLRSYFILAKSKWNKLYDITLYGHDVEVYVEDIEDERTPSPVYSIVKEEWLSEPSREEMSIDYDGVTKKVNEKIDEVDELQALYEDGEFEDAYRLGVRLRSKMKNFRQSGLEREGEYSNENLAFKVLRRSGDLDRMNEYVKLSYIKIKSYGE